MTRREHTIAEPVPPAAPQPTFRSGAVARLADMPVSTLRIWEQRYRAVRPTTAPSGHRLYSAADVQRVRLLRQLTRQGHAIGALAALDGAQLQQVARTEAESLAGRLARPARRSAALRVAVVGEALALRLQRPAVVQHLVRRWQVTAVFESLAEATQAASGAAVDLLLWQAAGLQESSLPDLRAAGDAWRARQVAVTYRFAGAAARTACTATGARVMREPAADAALGGWLASLEGGSIASADAPDDPPAPRDSSGSMKGSAHDDVTPRRFNDGFLTAFAGLATTTACECPRHVAELLLQLSNFEAYSAECAERSPADADLHAYLQRVSGAARALFESALERVAVQEGLALP